MPEMTGLLGMTVPRQRAEQTESCSALAAGSPPGPLPPAAACMSTYTVDLPAGAIKDAAGNAAPAATLGTFALNVGSPNDPDLQVAITPKFPAGAVIAGTKSAKGTAKVTVTNIGATAITKQSVPVTLYLSD